MTGLAVLVAVAPLQSPDAASSGGGGLAGFLAGLLLLVIVVAGIVGFARNVRRSRRDR